MANFDPAFSGEMLDQMVLDVYEYVKAGMLSEKKVIGVSREMIEKRDDGRLVYYDIRVEGNEKPIGLDTMIGRIRIIVNDWKKYIAPLLKTLVLEAAYQHAVRAKDNVASFKAVSELVMPKESGDDEDKLAVPPRVSAILQQNPVGTTINIGKDNGVEGVGDKGYERIDTMHPLADGDGLEDKSESQSISAEVVSFGDDRPVHEVHEGADTAEGSVVSDTPVSFEDTVDNNGWDDMGSD